MTFGGAKLGETMARLYVGNIDSSISEADLEFECRRFLQHGALDNVWVARNPGGFGFVEFGDARDAEACVRELHDARLGNQRLKVEFAKSRGKNAAPGASGSTSAAPAASVAPDAGQTTSKPKPVRVKHRAVLEGLPPSFTWKELKDEMRRIGRILYADIDEHGDGIVDFESADDLDYAVRVINGSMLDGAVIRVRRAGDSSSSGAPSEERREPERRRDDDRRRPRDERERSPHSM